MVCEVRANRVREDGNPIGSRLHEWVLHDLQHEADMRRFHTLGRRSTCCENKPRARAQADACTMLQRSAAVAFDAQIRFSRTGQQSENPLQTCKEVASSLQAGESGPCGHPESQTWRRLRKRAALFLKCMRFHSTLLAELPCWTSVCFRISQSTIFGIGPRSYSVVYCLQCRHIRNASLLLQHNLEIVHLGTAQKQGAIQCAEPSTRCCSFPITQFFVLLTPAHICEPGSRGLESPVGLL